MPPLFSLQCISIESLHSVLLSPQGLQHSGLVGGVTRDFFGPELESAHTLKRKVFACYLWLCVHVSHVSHVEVRGVDSPLWESGILTQVVRWQACWPDVSLLLYLLNGSGILLPFVPAACGGQRRVIPPGLRFQGPVFYVGTRIKSEAYLLSPACQESSCVFAMGCICRLVICMLSDLAHARQAFYQYPNPFQPIVFPAFLWLKLFEISEYPKVIVT